MMMKKHVSYEIEENVALAVRRVLAKISDTDFRGTYGLTDLQLEAVHTYMDYVDGEE